MTPAEALEQVRAENAKRRWNTEGNSRFREKVAAILDAVTPDAPVTVETVDDVYRHFESGGEAFAVRDTRTQLWLVWDNEDGDIYATSWPVEGGLESNTILLDGAVRGDSAVYFPATVLTPATPERTEQEREEAVERVAEAMCDASPEHYGWLHADERERDAWRSLARAAYEGREVSE